MNSAIDPDPLQDVPPGGVGIRGLLVSLLVLLGLAVAVTMPTGMGWRPVLLIGAGAAAMGVLHWIRLRGLQRRAGNRIDALRTENQELEEALDAATGRAEKLKEMRTARSQFLEEVSHAFRRPLTLTLGPIDTLLEGKYGALGEDVRTQLRVAERNGTRLLWLVNQLLDLAELETDNMVLTPTKDNLPAFVARGVRSFESLAERRNVTLEFESALEDPTAWFDPSKMETILANLLSGAFRATDEGESIRVTVRPTPDRNGEDGGTDADRPTADLELLVEHTGATVRSERETGPFKWSIEEEPAQEPGAVSTSVGLRLVDELADLHGGHLQVSRSDGETGQFAVRLPRRPAAGQEEGDHRANGDTESSSLNSEAQNVLALSRKAVSSESTPDATGGRTPEPPSFPNSAGQGPLPGEEALPERGARSGDRTDAESDADPEDRTTVLVIDDNSVICTLVRSHLEPEYRVEEAHDGAEGYSLARRVLPDLVITDVMMPEVDGFELCRKIKEDPDIDHVPVIFLTARADLQGKVEGFDVGADAYLTKPFEPEELIARVESLIATRQALRESFRAERGDGATRSPAAEDSGLSAEGIENAEAALPPTAEADSLKEQIEETIAEHLTDPEFGVSELASATALSASQLRRRMKDLYDRTPVQLIRRRRLEAGARLLREREDATIGEVAFAVGFNSQSYFSRSFRKEFGMSPSRYREGEVRA